MAVRLGTAAWAVPRACADAFPSDGSVLERYARVFDAVEINSTFYRSHRRATYERWAASTPAGFRFSAKVPRAITHEARLCGCDALVAAFLDEVAALSERLGPLLLQLPPSLPFEAANVEAVLRRLTPGAPGGVACEPRHASWFTPEVDRWLAGRRVARVAADPPRAPGGDRPGGWPGLAYHRLHGSPRVYYSPYAPERLDALVETIRTAKAAEVWCIFDNTATGAATADALALKAKLATA